MNASFFCFFFFSIWRKTCICSTLDLHDWLFNSWELCKKMNQDNQDNHINVWITLGSSWIVKPPVTPGPDQRFDGREWSGNASRLLPDHLPDLPPDLLWSGWFTAFAVDFPDWLWTAPVGRWSGWSGSSLEGQEAVGKGSGRDPDQVPPDHFPAFQTVSRLQMHS